MPELIGRRTELAAAVEHLGRAVSGTSHLLLVDGVAGIGTTTFLRAVSGQLVGSGVRALSVSLTAAETWLSWAGLSGLYEGFDPSVRERLRPAQHAALEAALGGDRAGEVEPMLIAAALTQLLVEQVAATGPLLLIVDDLQWLDQATAAALAFAIRATAGQPLALAMAARPERRPIEPERLVPADRTLRLQLRGLSLAELQELLAAHFGVVYRRPELLRLHEASGGNVRHAIEVGRMLAAGHTLDDALPASLQALVADDLDRLAPEVRQALGAVALVARPTAAVIEEALPDAEAALAQAEAAGLIAQRGGRLVFAHPLLRAGLLDGMGGLRRRQLERQLAVVIRDPEERAVLLAATAPAADETLAAALADAAELAAARGATHVAADRFDRAAELTPPDGAHRSERLLRAAQCYTRAGDATRAKPLFEEALAVGLDPDLTARAVIGMSSVLAALSGMAATVEWLTTSVERLPDATTARLEVMLQLATAQVFESLPSAAATAAAALQLARSLGADEKAVAADLLLHCALTLLGEPVDLDALRHRVAAGTRPSEAANSAEAVFLGQMLVWADQLDAAIESEQAELQRAESNGYVTAEANALLSLSDAFRRCGRWDDAEAALERWAELTALTGADPTAEGTFAELAWLRAARGQLDQAWAGATANVELTKATPIWHFHAQARAGFVAMVRGQFDLALRHFEVASGVAEEIGLRDLAALPFRDDMVEVLLALGHTERAEREAAVLAERAAHAQRPRGLVVAARASALVAAAKGDLVHATAFVAEGLAALSHFADPFERARLLQLGGTVSRRAGRRAEAREQLDEARRLFEALRAAPFVERVDAELQRLGARTGRVDLLTAGEQQVADLVCAGRSNAEVASALFITSRTVEAHLTRVYRKLGVRSRAELIARRSSAAKE